ncbi:MAG: UDP-2,3-diacylglucosamine diphosphatase LpxI, partial [Pseudomonadota bacterium]
MASQTALRDEAPPIGILAGGGSLPLEIAASLKAQGRRVQIVVLEGEADDLAARPDTIVRNWGQIGGIISAFKSAGCRQILIVGSVSRPDLTRIKPDLGLFRALFTVLKLIRAGGDDAVLRGVIAYLAKKGLTVIGPADVAPGLLVKSGPMPGTKPLDDDNLKLAHRAFEVLTALAPFDVGQALVISQDGVEAIEGAEGTDHMLTRVAQHRRTKSPAGQQPAYGLLVKQPKAGQDLRVDLPAIGPTTVLGAVEANLIGLVAEASRVIALSRAALIERALAADVAVVGVTPKSAGKAGRPRTDKSSGQNAGTGANADMDFPVFRVENHGRKSFRDIDKEDAVRCAFVSLAMEPYGCGRVVVASRGHVLAVQAG